jgi:MFS family permease
MTVPVGFWILTVGEGILTAGYSISFPFLAVYLSGHRHLSMSLTGLFLALSLFITSFAHVIGGELSDAFGRKKVMVAAVFLRGLLIAVIAWIIKVDGNILVLLAVHPLGLFIGSFYNPAARAWVADSTAPARRMKAYGFLRIGTNAGWALGPAIGGLMAVSSYPRMFAITALIYMLCTLILMIFIKDSPVFEAREYMRADLRTSIATLKAPDFRSFCVFTFAIAMVVSQLVVSTSLYSTRYLGFNERQIGLLFSLNGTLVVGLQYFMTRLLERYRITTGLAAGALFYAAGYLTVGYSGAYISALIGVGVLTIGELAVSPGLQALGANMAPRREKGRYLGVQGLFQQVGASAGILIGTNAINFISPHYQQGPWLIIAGLALTAALGFKSLGRRLDPRVNGQWDETTPPSVESPETI